MEALGKKIEKKRPYFCNPTMLWQHVRIHKGGIRTNRIRQLGNTLLPLFADSPDF